MFLWPSLKAMTEPELLKLVRLTPDLLINHQTSRLPRGLLINHLMSSMNVCRVLSLCRAICALVSSLSSSEWVAMAAMVGVLCAVMRSLRLWPEKLKLVLHRLWCLTWWCAAQLGCRASRQQGCFSLGCFSHVELLVILLGTCWALVGHLLGTCWPHGSLRYLCCWCAVTAEHAHHVLHFAGVDR